MTSDPPDSCKSIARGRLAAQDTLDATSPKTHTATNSQYPGTGPSRQFEELGELVRKVKNFSPALSEVFENALCAPSEQR
jgi:hypothetical protein